MKSILKKNVIAVATVFVAIFAVVALFFGTDAMIKRRGGQKIVSEPLFDTVFGEKSEDAACFETENGLLFLSDDEVLKSEKKLSYLNTKTYYSKLQKNEQTLYSIYEYAFENSVTSFYVRRSLLENAVYNDVEVLIFLSLDHPLVEQNFKIITAFENPEGITGVNGQNEPLFMHVFLEMNNKENFNKKLEALKRASEIVNTVPEDFSKRETALYLYKELCNFCEYRLYSKSDKMPCYVYDALIGGVSHCDGFANAYSLLLNLAGIPCFEKARYDGAAEKTALNILGDDVNDNCEIYETPTGHTWNCFSVYGKLYDADPSYDSKDRLLKRNVKDVVFGFGVPSGFFPEYKTYDYMELAPECCDGFLISPDCEFKTAYDKNIEKELYYALKNTENGYVLAVFSEETSMEDLKNLAQKLCEYANVSVCYGRCPSSPVAVYFAFRNK